MFSKVDRKMTTHLVTKNWYV